MIASAFRISKDTVQEVFTAWLLPLVLLLCYGRSFGIFDDTLHDSIVSNYMRASLSSKPVTNFFVYHIFTPKIFVWLYTVFPSVAWLGIALVFFLWLSVVVSFVLLSRALVNCRIFFAVRVVLLWGCFHFCWYEHFQLLTLTKVAVACTGTGLLFLLLGNKKSNRSSDFFLRVVCWVMIIFGVLTRWETAGMAILFCVAVLPFRQISFIRVSKIFSGVAVLLLLMFGYEFFFLQGEDDRYFNATEPYIFNFHDSGNRIATLAEMATAADSARYIAAENWFFNDKEQLNVDFLKRLSVASTSLKINFSYLREKWVNAVPSFRELFIDRCLGLSILTLLLLVCAGVLYMLTPRVRLSEFCSVLYIPVAFLMVILLVAMVVKIEYRASAPLFTVMFTTLITAVFDSCSRSFFAARWWLPAILIVFGAIYWPVQQEYYKGLCRYETAETQFVEKARAEIDQRYSAKIIMPDNTAGVQLLCASPLSNVVLTQKNTWVFYDFAYSTFYPPFSRYLIHLFGSEKADDVFVYAQKHADKFVFIATEERIRFYEYYFQTVYNLPLRFVKDKAPTILETGGRQVGWQQSYNYYTLLPL